MYFRCAIGMILLLLVGAVAVRLEQSVLQLRVAISRQEDRLGMAMEQHARLRLATQQLGAPVRWVRPLHAGTLRLDVPSEPADVRPKPTPLLQWRLRGLGTDEGGSE